ncbi:MAG: hypothetical protein GF401_07600 [Chitinivibrionales bacterium]|nr:hypothetical protein [Chitinivibrionales bacterium]
MSYLIFNELTPFIVFSVALCLIPERYLRGRYILSVSVGISLISHLLYAFNNPIGITGDSYSYIHWLSQVRDHSSALFSMTMRRAPLYPLFLNAAKCIQRSGYQSRLRIKESA